MEEFRRSCNNSGIPEMREMGLSEKIKENITRMNVGRLLEVEKKTKWR